MPELGRYEDQPIQRDTIPGLYESTAIDHIKLRGRKLPGEIILSRGLNANMVESLIKRANDPKDEELRANTSDSERFKDREAYENWFKKGRMPFVLTDERDNVLALIWFGEKPFPPQEVTTENGWHTVAFRTYPPFRNMKLMTPLSQRFFDEYTKEHPGASYWLEVNSDNDPAIKLYEKIGFVKFKTNSNANNRVLMTMSKYRS